MSFLSLDPKELKVAQVHGYLLGAVAPRPIALVSTIDAEGNPNLSPFSFFNVFSANPPIAIFSPARRGRDNTTKHTYENAKIHKECVINIVNFDMVQQMSLSSTEYPQGVNEFIKSGFTPIDSEVVKPPRVMESPVQLECIIKEVIELGSEGGAGNLIVSEVVRIHINENVLDESGRIDPVKIDQVARLGGDWYSRAKDSLFSVAKPLEKMGIGVDQIPIDIRLSHVLTGNHLGQLGNVESLPNETEVNEYKLTELSDIFLEHEKDGKALEMALHHHAAKLLDEQHVTEAWMTLLSFNA
jgi:flavin reductase (DIM6/NTAB) family NADH-FMN oxidoreductase RutF